MLGSLKEAAVDIGGIKVNEKKLPLEEDADYLVRLGIAGPEGYDGGRRHSGVYSTKGGRAIYLLSFQG